MILYINVMLSETRLQVHYDRGLFGSTENRPDIFKYMISSLSVIDFKGVYIYYKFDEGMPDRFQEIDAHIYECFPDAHVFHYRSEYQHEWVKAIDQIKNEHPDELVWLLNNDDHIFVDSNVEYLERLTTHMRELSNSYPYVGLFFSHWGHFLDDFYLKPKLENSAGFIEDTDEYCTLPHRESGSAMILSMAALEDFWYTRDLGNEFLFRIDRIPSPEMLYVWPKRELVRHYDGYAHHGIDIARIPPLRIPPVFLKNK